MRAVVEGLLYNTDVSEFIHEDGFEDEDGGEYVQSLYRSPLGTFFYVNTFPHAAPMLRVLGEPTCSYRFFAGMVRGKSNPDDVDMAIAWLEKHDGSEVIMNRWPERIWCG